MGNGGRSHSVWALICGDTSVNMEAGVGEFVKFQGKEKKITESVLYFNYLV